MNRVLPYIAEIELTYQMHVKSKVILGPGLNVIVGASGAGKTSIIRAVRWVGFGEPSGDAFVHEDVKYAEVTITMSDGRWVRKSRKNDKTRYEIAGYEEPFDKAEVPAEVTQILNLVKTAFGDFETSLNFAYQLDPPFILSEPPSTGAKVLGKLSGTEVVDML